MSRVNRIATVVLLSILASTSSIQPTESFMPYAPANHAKAAYAAATDVKHRSSTGLLMSQDSKTSKKKDYQVQTRNPLRWLVLRLGLTEPAMTSPFNYGKYDGVFNCAYCGAPLFDSSSKYDSGSGWPSFWRSADSNSIGYKQEFDGRLECQCQRCSSHLGHVFLDGPTPASVAPEILEGSPDSDPRGRSGKYLPRFCVNGAAMTFESRDKKVEG